MAETIHVRGEGGSIIKMDLPLPDHIQARFDAGLIVRVNEDGSEPFHPDNDKPKGKAPAKAEDPTPEAASSDGDSDEPEKPKPAARSRRKSTT